MFSLEGGSLLGKGTYGCVFDPPLRCRHGSSSKQEKGQVGKITLPQDYEVEIAAARALGPLGVPYFLLANEESACQPSARQKEKELTQCTPLQTNPLSTMVHFTLPYGGKTFFSRLSDADFLHQNEFSFFKILLQMLEAGSYLIATKFCHYDISLMNVLVDKKANIGIIDFGMSFSAEDITEETVRNRLKVFNPASLAEVPEMTMVSGIVSNAGPVHELIDMIFEEKNVFAVAERVLGLNLAVQKREFAEFLETSNAIRNRDFATLWKLYWPTFDSLGIGMCLTYLLRRLLFQKSFVESAEWKQRGDVILYLLRGMLQANPRKRLDAVEALKLYDPENVWFEKYGTSWISSRVEQRRAVSASV